MNNLKKVALAGFLLTTFALMSACSTFKGFGKDVSHAGTAIQKVAR